MTLQRCVALVIAGLALALLPAPTSAQASSEAQLQTQVEQALAEVEGLGNLTVTVQDRVITLSGTVRNLRAKRQAIEAALGVKGFESLTSRLTIPAAESDAQLGELTTVIIRRYTFYTVFDDLNVRVSQGVVRLTGEVTEPHKKIDVEGMIERIPGVRDIDNQIEVLPVNGLDDRIRLAIRNGIYNNTLFSKYTRLPNPPIHIIVKNGRVRLTGVVNTNVESAFASTIARQVDGVRRFRNELRIETESPR